MGSWMGWEVGWVCGVCFPLCGLVMLSYIEMLDEIVSTSLAECETTEIGDGLDLG